MIDRHDCIAMASHSRWMNEHLYACCAELGDRGQLTTFLSQRGQDPRSTNPFVPGVARMRGAIG
jgi:hypothetical protein